MIERYLVAICTKHTSIVVEWIEVPATDWRSAVYQAFDLKPQYDGDTHYGEAVQIS